MRSRILWVAFAAQRSCASEVTDSELHDYTQVIIDEADRLHNLVDRLVGAKHPLAFSDTNIHEVLERVKSLAEADAASNDIRIIADYDPSIPTLQGDGEHLIQAMLNLVRNAIQSIIHTSPGSEQPDPAANPGGPKYQHQ